MSNLLWLVTATWAHRGREGATESIVEAGDAIGALRLFWAVEDDTHLRDVQIKWLGPVDCVIRGDDLVPDGG